ncbi:MAG: hypothetical protein EOP47_23865 [Sphingobacteriaceae bacterium]|nr:MAG: hypothetical protein EOP47_23865 [Sphingobacteriaceae bacterium]
MKINLIAFFIGLIMAGCSKKENTAPEGKIRSIEGYVSLYQYGQLDKSKEYLWEKEEFDNNGLLVNKSFYTEFTFDPVYSLMNYESYKYTNNGQLIETNRSSIYRLSTYKYSGDNIAEETMHYYTGSISRKVYEYDYKNRISRYLFYNSDQETPYAIEAYSYSGNTIIIDRSILGTPSGTILTDEYDSHGNLIKEVYKDKHEGVDEVRYLNSYTYNEDGKIVSSILSSQFLWKFYKTNYTYNKKGDVLNKTVAEGAKISGPFQDHSYIVYRYTFWKN